MMNNSRTVVLKFSGICAPLSPFEVSFSDVSGEGGPIFNMTGYSILLVSFVRLVVKWTFPKEEDIRCKADA